MKFPHALADSAHPKHVNINVGLALAPPSLDTSSLPAPVSTERRRRAGVNWTAEARRAVKAFEIRGRTRDSLGPRDLCVGRSAPHEAHAGDKYRTESGDWIVWIDATATRSRAGGRRPGAG